MSTREEHLAWCKNRAIELLDSGDLLGAVVSMISDLSKWKEPLYSADTLRVLSADGLMFRKTERQIRNWIEGFQ